MKMVYSALVLFFGLALPVHAGDMSPITKVVTMLADLETKLIGEGEASHKVYAEYSEFCEDKSQQLTNEIKTGQAEVAELTATIESKASDISSLTAKIEDLAGSIASDESDLKAATKVRSEEAADFAAEEKELNEVVSMLERAVGILEREMSKSGASMLQVKNAANLAQALTAMVQASVFSAADAKTLSAFVQSSQQSQDEDGQPGAPEAAAYESQSGNIVETLQGLLDKATSQLDKARREETTAVNNFEMLKQSLTDQMKFVKEDMEKAKKAIAEAGETKSTAEGDLIVTSKDLKEDVAALEELHHECMTKASDYEAEVKSRDEELKALASAKKVIKEATGGAAEQSYSFLQIVRRSDRDSHAVRFVRTLSMKQNSAVLAQLAQRMQSALRFGAMAGEDPFAKVKSLITDMIAKLEKDASEDATEKSYCDKEMRETTEKKEDKEGEIDALSTKIDQMSSQSAKLKEQVATLQKELAELANSQKEMDQIREAEKALYDKNQPEMSKGLDGIKAALKVLTEYYAGKDSGAGSGIISMLEVIESDFTKGLAEIEATESSAVDAYEAQNKENEIEKTAKDQDVKYKTKESTGLDKSVAEATSDKEGVQAELDAVMQYDARIKDRCVAKAETYEEAKSRREAEIAGCKEALSILEGEAALLQIGLKERSHPLLRGLRLPHMA